MRRATLAAAAIAIATGLAGTVPAANAMPVSTPGQLGLAEGAAGALEKRTVLICDPWTCYWRPSYWGYYGPDPNWGWRRHYWWGWLGPPKSLIQKRSWL